MPKITDLFAFVMESEHGEEGVPAVQIGHLTMPLIGADLARVEGLMEIAQELANQQCKPIRIVKSVALEQIGEVRPR